MSTPAALPLESTGKLVSREKDRVYSPFVEIFPANTASNSDSDDTNKLTEVYVATIEPSQCSSLVKRLSSELPLHQQAINSSYSPQNNFNRVCIDLSHLKRVKKVTTSEISITSIKTEAKAKEKTEAADPTTTPENIKQDENKKRRRQQPTNLRSNVAEACKKKKKGKGSRVLIHVLLGAVCNIDQLFRSNRNVESDIEHNTSAAIEEWIKNRWKLLTATTIDKVWVPAQPAASEKQWKLHNNQYWPMRFYQEKTPEFQHQQAALTTNELEQMKFGMQEAILDAKQYQKQQQAKSGSCGNETNQSLHTTTFAESEMVGAVVMCPTAGKIVSRAHEERVLQQNYVTGGNRLKDNPLATAIMLAIQGVSRMERAAACAKGLDSSEFQRGQYLCTNYDLYCTLEPTVYEAMASVHARMRRVVFGYSSSNSSIFTESYGLAAANPGTTVTDVNGSAVTATSLRSALVDMSVHCLPGTNHKYRAFMCQPSSEQWNECRQMSKTREIMRRK